MDAGASKERLVDFVRVPEEATKDAPDFVHAATVTGRRRSSSTARPPRRRSGMSMSTQ
jgi:hypothetical protein